MKRIFRLLEKLRGYKNSAKSFEIKLYNLQKDYDRREEEWKRAANKLREIELQALMSVRKDLDLQYMEVSGKAPILWINSPDRSVVNHGTFANIKDRMSRLAPDIEMFILTYGNVKLWELDDKDLAKIGLCRIIGHIGGTVTDQIEDKR